MTLGEMPVEERDKTPESWHALDAEAIIATLATPPERGLTNEEAARRLQKYGLNQLTEAPGVTIWQMLWEQINNFIVWLLIGAVIISAIVGDVAEALLILAIVILNAALGVFQTNRAERALAVLKQLAAPEAHALRQGQRVTVPARELVPGDIVILETGNYVPADIRLIEAVNLRIEEAALTGESVPVEKDAKIRVSGNIQMMKFKKSK